MDIASPPPEVDLSPSETLAARIAADMGAALAEALTARLDQAAEALGADGPAEMVHEVRKALKDYRALLRLVPGPEAKAARRDAAATARQLSEARDRQAALDALEALSHAGLLDSGQAERAQQVLTEVPSAAAEPADHRREVTDFLERARTSLAGPVGAAARETDVAAGLAKGYRRARTKPDFSQAQTLHELRKAVVTHRYQMAFLADVAGAGRKRARKAQRLRDILGIHQDLEALRPILAEALGTHHEALMSDVAAASRTLQRRLVKAARAQHGDLFERPAKVFAARIARRMVKAPPRPEPATTG
ncbi:hypothetical protein GCM10007301_09440 [Azorhizobium oxalatiphilum]|uniref:CHAD domain-containing protein n=1 Tax=Azorhizobium oxalatiphilum TaxID=980631 RepID=A0A917F5K5_9HYPH|nr:CHAD domain-containing protein [Azorhizobium oxalatiphilum]GGF52086.1 hypothetical protein GCM10007301_09440 [Azorhizobium oxalatiphilum]